MFTIGVGNLYTGMPGGAGLLETVRFSFKKASRACSTHGRRRIIPSNIPPARSTS